MAWNRGSSVDASMAPVPRWSELISTASRWTPAAGRRWEVGEEVGSRWPMNGSTTMDASMAPVVPRRLGVISTVDRRTPASGRPGSRCREEDGRTRSPVNEVHALTCGVDISDRLDAFAALNKRSNARSAMQPVQLCLHLWPEDRTRSPANC